MCRTSGPPMPAPMRGRLCTGPVDKHPGQPVDNSPWPCSRAAAACHGQSFATRGGGAHLPRSAVLSSVSCTVRVPDATPAIARAGPTAASAVVASSFGRAKSHLHRRPVAHVPGAIRLSALRVVVCLPSHWVPAFAGTTVAAGTKRPRVVRIRLTAASRRSSSATIARLPGALRAAGRRRLPSSPRRRGPRDFRDGSTPSRTACRNARDARPLRRRRASGSQGRCWTCRAAAAPRRPRSRP